MRRQLNGGSLERPTDARQDNQRKQMIRNSKERTVVGWREWVALPEMGIERIKAKIDTGARTSALHAYRITRFRRGRRCFVRFFVHPVQRHRHPEVMCEALLLDERVVTSSNGKRESRYVVETMLRVGTEEWPIEITLTNRDEMSFRLLLGRQALRRHVVIDPSSSFKLSRKTRKKRTTKKLRRKPK